ncbi:MAG: hypothetical protein ABUL58_02565 [Steroidobacter sp.]
MNHRAFIRMGKSRRLACLLFAFASIVLAEKTAEPSDDFLAYLGDMEDGDDNWSDFADEHTSKAEVHAQQASSTSSTSSQGHGTDRSASGRSRT